MSPDPTQIKSEGHLCFAFLGTGNACEFFLRGEEVYRAPLHNVIALDTNQRHARWYGPLWAWEKYDKKNLGL